MSAHRSARDRRRRTLGQNFLADERTIRRLVAALDVRAGELILEPGAGRGALTFPLAEAGAHVIAVERDPHWTRRLRAEVDRTRRPDSTLHIDVRRDDIRRAPLPDRPFRVVGNPPFGLTTELLARFLDPSTAVTRIDLVVQSAVARKHATTPPQTLRTAAWAPWWTFEVGLRIPRTAFRPVPRVDAALLTIRRRPDPVLPEWLAADLRELLRPAWQSRPSHPGSSGSRPSRSGGRELT